MELEDLVSHYEIEQDRILNELEKGASQELEAPPTFKHNWSSTIVGGATGTATGLLSALWFHSPSILNFEEPNWCAGIFLGGMEGLLIKYALSLRKGNSERRKSVTIPYERPLLDRVLFDFPVLAGVAATIVGYRLFSSGVGPSSFEGRFSGSSPGIYAVDTFLAGLSVEVLTQLSARYFDTAQIRRMLRYGKASWQSLTRRQDAAIKSLESILELPLVPSQLAKAHYSIGRRYLEQNDYGSALAEFDAGLKLAPPEKRHRLTQLFGGSSKEKRRFDRIKESENPEELTREGLICYSKGLTLKADYCFARALYLNPGNLFLHWIRADALGMNGRHEEEEFERNAFLDLIFSDSDLESKFMLQHDSRNEIAFYTDPKFPAFSVVLKRSRDRESIDLEYRVTNCFAEALGERVVKPFAVREHNGFYYMVMPHAGSRLYEEVTRGNYRTEQFRTIIDFLVDYFMVADAAVKEGIIKVDDVIGAQTYRTIDGGEIPNRDAGTLYFSNRIDDIAIGYMEREIEVPEKVIKLFRENSWVLNKRLEKLDRVVSKDANLKNFYRASSGSIIAGDFESLKYVPALCELSRLLEFGFEFLSDAERDKLLDYYLAKWTVAHENRKPRKSELKEFRRNYEFAALYDNLILLGYRARDALRATSSEERQEDYREELFHLKSAGKHIQKILGLESILDEEKLALAGLNEGIGALIDVVELNYGARTIKTKPVKTRLTTYLARAGLGILLIASAGIFARQLFSEKYQREAIAVSVSVESPKKEESIYVIDTRTGKLLYNPPITVNAFDWNPEKAEIVISSNGKKFTSDLKSVKKEDIGEGHTNNTLLISPDGNYMVLRSYGAINIFDKYGKLVEGKDGRKSQISGDYPEWAPNGGLLGLISGKFGTLGVVELKDAIVKEEYRCPVKVDSEFEFSPDSKKIAYVSNEEGQFSLYIAKSNFGAPEILFQSEQPISNLRWHDNILYFERAGIYEAENGDINQLTQEKDASFEISKDGKSILVNEYDKLYVKNLKSEEETVIDAPFEDRITNALFTPDGTSVFYTVETGTGINAYLFSFEHNTRNLVLELCQNMEPSQQCKIEQIK